MKKITFFAYAVCAVAALFVLPACGRGVPAPTGVTQVMLDTPIPSATEIPAATLNPGDSQHPISVNGLERTYLLHIPSGIKATGLVPLVFVFHGFRESGIFVQQTSVFNDVADKGSFIVVYPDGSGDANDLSWNAGGCCGYADLNNVDDEAFIRQIIADLHSFARIDPKRTFATGFSNGALLSYRLACEMSDTFAAVAPVAGALLTNPCLPGHSVSVIQFQGLNDAVVPYAGGGVVPSTGQPFPPTEQSIATWVHLDECANSPELEQTDIYTHTSYSFCNNGTAVELYAVKAVGHSWPSQYVLPASQLIWKFFASHPKP